jgi:hypothetical protein
MVLPDPPPDQPVPKIVLPDPPPSDQPKVIALPVPAPLQPEAVVVRTETLQDPAELVTIPVDPPPVVYVPPRYPRKQDRN